MEMRKGFYFSFDSLLALTVLAGSLFLVTQTADRSSSTFQANTIGFQQSSYVGRDAMKVSSLQSFQNFNDSFKNELVQETVMEEEDLNRTILDGIGLLWAAQNYSYARMAAKSYYDSKIPDRYGFSVRVNESGNGSVIYNTSYVPENTSYVSASSRLVSGHRIGKPSEGYQARARLTKFTDQETKTVTYGGYVGDGNIRSNVTLPNYSTVKNVTLEGDFTGNFSLSINGQAAGSYTRSRNSLEARNYQICTDQVNESRCEAFQEGYNTVSYTFPDQNKSITGAFMRITYNRTERTREFEPGYQVKKKKIPGINGIINYYSSFYVPGNVEGVEAKLSYEVDNQTVFMKIGNSTVFQNRTDGSDTVTVDNESIHSNLSDNDMSYETLSRNTVPLRIGLKNIDRIYSRAIADSVAVIDDSGSMGGSKIEEAKKSAKTFGDIILNASGNRAGVVGYDDAVTQTQPLTKDQEALNNTVDSLVADGGTCIACGILEAIDLLDDIENSTLIERGSELTYNDSFTGSPPVKDGFNWTEVQYNDSSWSEGEAVLGQGAPVDTQVDASEQVYFRESFFYEPEIHRGIRVAVRSDDASAVWVNGHKVFNESSEPPEYWNTVSGRINFDPISEFQESFERTNFGPNWTVVAGTEGDDVDLNGNCGAVTGSRSLYMDGAGGVVETSLPVQSSSDRLSIKFSVKQGSGYPCESPDSGEDVYFQYLDQSNNWQTIDVFRGGGSNPPEGSWEEFSYDLSDSEIHNGLEFRFYYPGGSEGYDQWGIDDFNLQYGNTTTVPGVNSSWLNDGENVVAAKLRSSEREENTLTVDSGSKWLEGGLNNLEVSSGNLRLESDGFYDGFDDGSLGAGWSFADLDSAAGTSRTESGGELQISSNGADTWNSDDEYGSVYRTQVAGDWNTTVTVESMGGAHQWEKTGIMARNDMTSPGSSQGYVFLAVTDGNGYSLQWDSDGDGFLDSSNTQDSKNLPAEIRLERSGDQFTGYYRGASDTTWSSLGTVSPPGTDSNLDLGLSHTSHSSGTVSSSSFDDFTIDRGSFASSGYYTRTLDFGQEVNFTAFRNTSALPADTSTGIEFISSGTEYANIEDVPETSDLTLNLSMSTADTSRTPEFDSIEIDYNGSAAEFDMQVNVTEKRRNSMIVLSDGEATQQSSMTDVPDHNNNGYVDDADHAIEAGCRAGEKDIKVYTIGFGDNVNDDTLNDTAECGNGTYYQSDTGELKDVFRNISNRVLNASFVGQRIETNEEEALGRLDDSSYIRFNYSGGERGTYGSISVQKQASNFGDTIESPRNGSFLFPEGTEPVSARLASYSDNRWTDRVYVNSSGSWDPVFQLWNYASEYQSLGDPFIVNIPSNRLKQARNYLSFDTALAKPAPQGGSPDSKVLYEFNVENFVGYGKLFPNRTAARKDAEKRLKEKLDLDGDGEPVVSPSDDGFNYSNTFTDNQPYIWGPAEVRLVIWQ